jgi:hypothetical protein
MSNEEGMLLIKLGWHTSYVLPIKDGIELIRIIGRAESYSEEYDSTTKVTMTHVWHDADNPNLTATLLSTAKYNVAKLAGKPETK